MRRPRILDLSLSVIALFSLVFTSLVWADSSDDIKKKLNQSLNGIEIASVVPATSNGLYEVQTTAGEILYVSGDAQFIFTGDMLQVTPRGVVNVTEATRSKQRVDAIASVPEKQLITYPAKGETKAEISVFTDIDCGYCRKLHSEMAELNDLGITVHYFAFPRSGPNTPSFYKYVSVWCSDDRNSAMNVAKAGQAPDSKTCENPVEQQYALGHQLGVTGTPAIVLQDGSMIRGYVPAKRLAEGLGIN